MLKVPVNEALWALTSENFHKDCCLLRPRWGTRHVEICFFWPWLFILLSFCEILRVSLTFPSFICSKWGDPSHLRNECKVHFLSLSQVNPALVKHSPWRWVVEHVMFPSIRTNLIPSRTMAEDGSILQIADLRDLYRVFERCWCHCLFRVLLCSCLNFVSYLSFIVILIRSTVCRL